MSEPNKQKSNLDHLWNPQQPAGPPELDEEKGVLPVAKLSESQKPAMPVLPPLLQPGATQEAPTGFHGFLVRVKQNKLTRQAALNELQAVYEGRLQAIQHSVTQMVRVAKAEVNYRVSEHLQVLNADHVKILTDLGVKTAATRLDACHRLGDEVDAAVQKINNSNWQQPMKDLAIREAFALYRREHAKFMEDLGAVDVPN